MSFLSGLLFPIWVGGRRLRRRRAGGESQAKSSRLLALDGREGRGNFETAMGASEANGVEQMMQELRHVFASGKTRDIQWRIDQLNGIIRLVDERSAEFVEAMAKDIRKPAPEAMWEVSRLFTNSLLSFRFVSFRLFHYFGRWVVLVL